MLLTIGISSYRIFFMTDEISRRIKTHLAFSHLLFVVGFLMILSALIVNPWIGKYYRRFIEVFYDEMLQYAICGLFLGILLIFLSFLVRKTKKDIVINFSLLLLIITSIVSSDRLLLARLGKGLYMYDPVLHYRNRPNKIWNWGINIPDVDKNIKINRYGHYDENFPEKKSKNEFRILVLGDSIVMGYGVSHRETFASQLEEMLKNSGSFHRKIKVINTGVPGYAPFQELIILKESLRFKPDLLLLGFCMNDLMEPFLVNRAFGGRGLDDHLVMQTRLPILGWLYNETGFGRMTIQFLQRKTDLETERRKEIFEIKYMVQNSDQSEVKKAFAITLGYVKEIFDTARENDMKALLMIFPYRFQVEDKNFRSPQRTMTVFASENNIDVIDFTDVCENLLKKDKITLDDIFIDNDHFTPEGNKKIAEVLLKWLVDKKAALSKNL